MQLDIKPPSIPQQPQVSDVRSSRPGSDEVTGCIERSVTVVIVQLGARVESCGGDPAHRLVIHQGACRIGRSVATIGSDR